MILALTKPKYFIPVHGEYRMLVKHAEIGKMMGVQPKNVVIGENGKVIEREVSYKADFVYFDIGLNKCVVEDTKGFRTKDYIIKRKLMLFVHGIRIVEV